MSIHFYKKGKVNTTSLFELTDETFEILEPSFNKFEKKTGIFIDPYGRTALYPDNLQLLCEMIRQDFPQASGKNNGSVELIIKQFLLLYQSNDMVEAIGD